MAPPHKTAAAVAVLVFLVTMAPAATEAKRPPFMLPVSVSHMHKLTAEDNRAIYAIDVCFERALNASAPAPVVDKFPLFEATLAKCLAEVNDNKFVPKVLSASAVASAVAAGVDSPDEKFAVYFARLTQVLTGTVDADDDATKPPAATAGTKTAAGAGTA